MGNTNSSSTPISSDAARFDLEFEILLERLRVRTVDDLVNTFRWIDFKPENSSLLDLLATKIVEHANVKSPDLCLKCVKVAKGLENFKVKDSKEDITFKDIFLKKATVIFKEIEATGLKTTEEKKRAAEFLGNLFNVGIVSSVLMTHWLTSIKNQPEVHQKMLTTIEDKVKLESQRPFHDKNVEVLINFLQSNEKSQT
jgi:hypothetical protein